MRKEVGKAFRRCLDERLASSFPQFRKIKPTWPGCLLYEWQVSPQLAFYLFFLPDIQFQTRDCFAVEVGWSRTRALPEFMRGTFDTWQPAAETLAFRMAFLWGRRDERYWFGEEETADTLFKKMIEGRFTEQEPLPKTLAGIPARIDEVIGKIRQYVIPYFRRVARAHRVSFPRMPGV